MQTFIMYNVISVVKTRAFCDGTRRYGVPGNENDESTVCMSVLYWYDKLIMGYRHLFERNIKNVSNP